MPPKETKSKKPKTSKLSKTTKTSKPKSSKPKKPTKPTKPKNQTNKILKEDIDTDSDVESDTSDIEDTLTTFQPEITKHITYVHPDNRKTSDIMSIFEYTELVSISASRIQKGGNPYIDLESTQINIEDPIEIAKEEIRQKKCPLKIIRHLTPHLAEVWHANELAIPM